MSQILNFEYTNQAANLISGSVQGLNVNSGSQTVWEVIVAGGNQVMIQDSATGMYASAYEFQGAAVVGSPDPYYWQLLTVVGGPYQIATQDGYFVWSLTGGKDYAPVVLQETRYGTKDAQWNFGPA